MCSAEVIVQAVGRLRAEAADVDVQPVQDPEPMQFIEKPAVEFGVIECLADSAIDRRIEARDGKKCRIGHRSQAARMHCMRVH